MMTTGPFAFSAEVPALLQRHFDALQHGSGLPLDVIREREYRSVVDRKDLAELRFGPAQQLPPGLLVPVRPPDGSNGLYTFRPDYPRAHRDGKEVKYELPRGMSARLDVPPRCQAMLGDPQIPIWITEGQKKADALATHGFCAVAVLGVWNWKGRNGLGGITLLADFDHIAWNGRTVNLVFDSDVMQKREVKLALERLIEHLRRRVAR
jgi:hypothetical protein